MIGVVVGIGLVALFLLADLIVWRVFCHAIQRMEWSDEEKASRSSQEVPWPIHRAPWSGQSTEDRASH
jgi:hypothetical protein